MSKNLREIVDTKRGDVPRSVFISKILEQICKNNDEEHWAHNNVGGQWGLSRRQPLGGPTVPSVRPAEEEATNG